MDTSTKIRAIYYGAITIINISFCASLLAILDWPLFAEVPLLVCLFIEIQFLSKAFYTSFLDGQEEYLIQYILKLKESFFNVEA